MPQTTTSASANNVVSAELRRRRRELGLTQAVVARRLEVSEAYVQKVEAGRANLTVGQVARFADALQAVFRVDLAPLPEPEPLLARLQPAR